MGPRFRGDDGYAGRRGGWVPAFTGMTGAQGGRGIDPRFRVEWTLLPNLQAGPDERREGSRIERKNAT